MIIIDKNQIKHLLNDLDLKQSIIKGFIDYSAGKCVIPPIGELLFKNPPGDVHIKYGYIINGKYYVIKIASGFPMNEENNISNGQGLMLLFNQKTGEPLATLLDDAILTDIRTAIAGLICAEKFSNNIKNIGVLGTGNQARLQVQFLKRMTDCRSVSLWGRNKKKAEKYKSDMSNYNFNVKIFDSPQEIAKNSNLIITATASEIPLLKSEDIKIGTHITALGADTPVKNELDTSILKRADMIIVDSISQCKERGEIFHALSRKDITLNSVNELGSILSGDIKGRTSKDQITVADLTGVAVQDLKIAEAVYEKFLEVYK